MRSRISPKTKRKYQKAIKDVIKGFSRKITIYRRPVKSECPNCHYDKLTDRSTGKCKWTIEQANAKQAAYAGSNPNTETCSTKPPTNIRYKWFRYGRCPICNGRGYLETKRRTWADCIVTWDPSARGAGNEMIFSPAGTEGSSVVQLKTDPKYFDTFKNCDYLVVDGINCKISRPPILRGLGTQSILIITAFTTDKPKIDSGEIVKEYI
jgi:hypothetical protein